MSKVKCFNCGKKGHIAPNCPENEDNEQEVVEKDNKKKQFVMGEDKVAESDMEGNVLASTIYYLITRQTLVLSTHACYVRSYRQIRQLR
jgi:hypothetical protein